MTPTDPTEIYAAAPLERFAPGIVFGGRYRIVAPLGKGGMGDVYRADDLTLGQPVALKFLPEHVTADVHRLTNFRKEVAAARRVSHPNVCRVYDIAEHEGQPFLTMEFIDGEDLASVIRRMGRVPEEKGVEIGRQLCSALAAVHDLGLLHRDLKPANVMLDGRGKVRLTDFGLAADARTIVDIGSGTPLYMAPEQLSRKDVTQQSDLFALGLVLYEVFTGKRAFPAETRGELAKQYSDGLSSKPSDHAAGMNPSVERVIVRCLAADPADRPRSASEVLASLPGGDPLAAAVAAGETPSPQLVAEAGEIGLIRPRTGVLLVLMTVVSLAVIAISNDVAAPHRRAKLTESPEEMARRSRQVIAELGYPERMPHSASFYRSDPRVYPRASAAGEKSFAEGQPPVYSFVFRQSPVPLVASLDPSATDSGIIPNLTATNPPTSVPGMSGVVLDSRGRLIDFYAIPPQKDLKEPPSSSPANWDTTFRLAGLTRASFREETPEWTPPCVCDSRVAWSGTYPDRPDLPVRVEAASYRGRPVFFRVVGEWTPAERDPVQDQAGGSAYLVMSLGVYLSVIIAALLLAVRNYRRGQADLRTATRLGIAFTLCSLAIWLLQSSHSGSFFGEWSLLCIALGGAAIGAVQTMALYLAAEPVIRRRWPGRMTGWVRLLAGRIRNPLVGRDLLFGVACGCCVNAFGVVLRSFGSTVGLFDIWFPGNEHVRRVAGSSGFDTIAFVFQSSLAGPLFGVFLLLLFSLIFRKRWLVVSVFALLPVLGYSMFMISYGYPTIAVVIYALWIAIVMTVEYFIIMRFGLGCLFWMYFTYELTNAGPLTTDTSAWYFTQSLVIVLFMLALAGYGYYTATGGQKLLKPGFFGDD